MFFLRKITHCDPLSKIVLDAVESGIYVWPRMGFGLLKNIHSQDEETCDSKKIKGEEFLDYYKKSFLRWVESNEKPLIHMNNTPALKEENASLIAECSLFLNTLKTTKYGLVPGYFFARISDFLNPSLKTLRISNEDGTAQSIGKSFMFHMNSYTGCFYTEDPISISHLEEYLETTRRQAHTIKARECLLDTTTHTGL